MAVSPDAARQNALRDLAKQGAKGLPSDSEVRNQKASPEKPHIWTGDIKGGGSWSLRKDNDSSYWTDF